LNFQGKEIPNSNNKDIYIYTVHPLSNLTFCELSGTFFENKMEHLTRNFGDKFFLKKTIVNRQGCRFNLRNLQVLIGQSKNSLFFC
jgi:hypothetical protein